MTKLACRADLEYNKIIRTFAPAVLQTPRSRIHLIGDVPMDTIPQKRCTNCKQLLPATPEFFHRSKAFKSGLASKCKECINAYTKEYYSRPNVKEQVKVYRQRLDVREHRNAQNRAYRKLLSEEDRVRNNAYRRAYYRTHPRDKETRLASVHAYQARKKAVQGIYTPEQIQDLLKRQKQKCYYCLAKFEKRNGKYAYHIDHTFPIHRVAGTDIPANDISYLVLACPTCNLRKNNRFPWEFPEGGKLL